MNELIETSLLDAQHLLSTFIQDSSNIDLIRQAGDLMVDCYRNGGKILSCGNGGSICDAMHFAEELTGRFRNDRKPLPAIAISDSSHITCVANDYGFDSIFSRYVAGLGKEGDILLAISTSGNSLNVNNAIKAAHENGMKVVGLTGKQGGTMKDNCDVCIVVPWQGYSDRIQEIHIKIIHILIEYIEKNFFI